MNLTSLKKMLATLKPLAKDAYKARDGRARGGRGGRAGSHISALFEARRRPPQFACNVARRRQTERGDERGRIDCLSACAKPLRRRSC